MRQRENQNGTAPDAGRKPQAEAHHFLRESIDAGNADRPVHGLQSSAFEKIATEIQLTDYEQESLDKVMELISRLEHIERELYKLIEVGEEGQLAHNDSLKAGVRLAREIIPKLEEIIQQRVDTDKSAALEGVLTEFAKRLRKIL